MAYPILILEREVVTLKSYEELRKEFIEEVEKIDISKLSLGGFGNSYREYAQLLQEIYRLPESKHSFEEFMCCGFNSLAPKVESEEK